MKLKSQVKALEKAGQKDRDAKTKLDFQLKASRTENKTLRKELTDAEVNTDQIRHDPTVRGVQQELQQSGGGITVESNPQNQSGRNPTVGNSSQNQSEGNSIFWNPPCHAYPTPHLTHLPGETPSPMTGFSQQHYLAYAPVGIPSPMTGITQQPHLVHPAPGIPSPMTGFLQQPHLTYATGVNLSPMTGVSQQSNFLQPISYSFPAQHHPNYVWDRNICW